jgi:hypothetical protein
MQTHPNNQPDTWSVYTCVLCLILFFVCILSGIEKLWANTHCDQAISMAQDGDLIFIDLPNPIFKQVAVSTQSWTSHLGLLLRADNGDWLVAESRFPRGILTHICSFINRSKHKKFEVKRYSGSLNALDISRLRSKALSQLDTIYDLGFDMDSDKQFCTKLVYQAYQTIGIEVGQIQTFANLVGESADQSHLFWHLWFFGNIPWERRTLTPASQNRDSQFETVLRNF